MCYDNLRVGAQFQFDFDLSSFGQEFGLSFNKYIYRKLATEAHEGYIALGVVSQPAYAEKLEVVVVPTSWLDQQELVEFNGS